MGKINTLKANDFNFRVHSKLWLCQLLRNCLENETRHCSGCKHFIQKVFKSYAIDFREIQNTPIANSVQLFNNLFIISIS